MAETNPDRMIRFYFGQPADQRPSKEDVGEFIKEEMGLVRGEDEPRWSEGVGELIELGMDAWMDRLDSVSHGEYKRIQELEEKVANYQQEIEKLRSQLDQRRESAGLQTAAERVHRIKARILEVLCRNEAAGGHTGPEGMNYVELYEVARETGLEPDTVLKYSRTLAKSEYGEHVQLDDYEEKVKATSRTAFEDYCEAAHLDADTIRYRNDPQ